MATATMISMQSTATSSWLERCQKAIKELDREPPGIIYVDSEGRTERDRKHGNLHRVIVRTTDNGSQAGGSGGELFAYGRILELISEN